MKHPNSLSITRGGEGAVSRWRAETGAVAVLIALTLIGLIALILLAVQVGNVGMVRGMLQGGADQAALSGAGELDGTEKGLSKAKEESQAMFQGGRNFVPSANNGQDLSIAGDAFMTGVWEVDHPENGFRPTTDAAEANAVRVIGRKTDTANGEVPMFLGGFLGPETVAVQRTAIAALGACKSVPCNADTPIAVCQDALKCGEEITLVKSPSPVDNAAWTGFLTGANASNVRGMIDNCARIPAVETGDCISLNNGEIDSALQALKAKLDDFKAKNPCPNIRVPDLDNPTCDGDCRPATSGPPIDVNGDGTTDDADCGMPAMVPLIPCSPDIANDCGGGNTARNLNQSRQMSGFVMIVITEVVDSGKDKHVKGIPLCGVRIPEAPTGPGPRCDTSTPVCCATEPVLVNASL